MPKKNLSLTTVKSEVAAQAKSFMKEVQEELVREEQESFKDFIKASYRVILEKQKQVETLQREVDGIQSALKQAEKGNWKALEGLKIPARFFKEEVLRKHGKSLIAGSEELRFMDLYAPEEE